jgi:hypothetical protein
VIYVREYSSKSAARCSFCWEDISTPTASSKGKSPPDLHSVFKLFQQRIRLDIGYDEDQHEIVADSDIEDDGISPSNNAIAFRSNVRDQYNNRDMRRLLFFIRLKPQTMTEITHVDQA